MFCLLFGEVLKSTRFFSAAENEGKGRMELDWIYEDSFILLGKLIRTIEWCLLYILVMMINILKVTHPFSSFNRLSSFSMLDKHTLLKSSMVNTQFLFSRKGQYK